MDDGEGASGAVTDADFEAFLQVGEVTVAAADAALLRAVDAEGSLHGAAESLGRSYSRAHRRVGELESAAGPLVERRRGGADGGGSRLTATARELLARFDRLSAALSGTAGVRETVLTGTVRERDGELATVETPAGPVRALLYAEAPGDDVEVTVRADAVTLYGPEDVPAAGGTSARNRFDGTVADVERDAAVAHVAVDVGAATPLLALLTVDSLTRLDLQPGGEVSASFKATATRATPTGT